MEFKKRNFERAVKYGDDEDIREAADNLFRSASPGDEKEEATEFMSKTLQEQKHYDTRHSGNETQYDGVKIKTGPSPSVEIDDSDP